METEEQRAARIAAVEARRARRREEWRRYQESRLAGIQEARAEERRLKAAGAHRLTTSIRIGELLRGALPAFTCRMCGGVARLDAMMAGHAAAAQGEGVCSSCYAWILIWRANPDTFNRQRPTPPWRSIGGVAFLRVGDADVELGVLPTPPHVAGDHEHEGQGVEESGHRDTLEEEEKAPTL